jgi:hypothetical protein
MLADKVAIKAYRGHGSKVCGILDTLGDIAVSRPIGYLSRFGRGGRGYAVVV